MAGGVLARTAHPAPCVEPFAPRLPCVRTGVFPCTDRAQHGDNPVDNRTVRPDRGCRGESGVRPTSITNSCGSSLESSTAPPPSGDFSAGRVQAVTSPGGPGFPQMWTTCGCMGRTRLPLWTHSRLEVHDRRQHRGRSTSVHGPSTDPRAVIDRSSTGRPRSDQRGRQFSTRSTGVMTTSERIPLEDSSTHICRSDPSGQVRPPARRIPVPTRRPPFPQRSPAGSPAAVDSRTVVRAECSTVASYPVASGASVSRPHVPGGPPCTCPKERRYP